MRLRRFLLVILLAPSLSFGGNAFTVVSDFDDTAAIHGTILSNVFSRFTAYGGMPELYRGLKGSREGNEFFFLSAKPTNFEKAIVKFAENYQILANGFYTMPILPFSIFPPKFQKPAWSIPKYKRSRLDKIFQAHPRALVLIGDNTSHDAPVYHRFCLDHPGKVKSIYIHRVKKRSKEIQSAPVCEIQHYYTAAEVALSENQQKRLSDDSLREVLDALAQADFERIFPDSNPCPTESYFLDLAQRAGAKFSERWLDLTQELIVGCIGRAARRFEQFLFDGAARVAPDLVRTDDTNQRLRAESRVIMNSVFSSELSLIEVTQEIERLRSRGELAGLDVRIALRRFGLSLPGEEDIVLDHQTGMVFSAGKTAVTGEKISQSYFTRLAAILRE